jgi:hypothetical protein
MRRAAATLTLLVLAVGACGGDSEEDRALDRVCDARADINSQTEKLRNLTVSEATSGEVGDSVEAIRKDLETIGKAQADLADDRREEVQAANQAFTSQLRTIAGQLAAGGGTASAEEQLRAATQALATTYRDTYGRIDCPGD